MTTYRDITWNDRDFLWLLLQQRNASINISHKPGTTYHDHCEFVQSNPYPFYKIIEDNNLKIGYCYVTKLNEIGIFIDVVFQGMGYGREAIKYIESIYKGQRLLANVSPRNIRSQKLFKSLGFELIQFTYSKSLL